MDNLNFELSMEENFSKVSMQNQLGSLKREDLIEVANNLIDLNYRYKAVIKQLARKSMGL